MNSVRKKKSPLKLFVAVFAALLALVILQNLMHEKLISLPVPNNAGASILETVGDRLVCVFLDGQVAVWTWGQPPQPQANFSVDTNRAVIISPEKLAAVNKTGKKMLTVYDLLSGEKQTAMSVGYDDQDIWPRISFDRSRLALIRKNPPGSDETILYEFLTADIDNQILGIPASQSLQADSETFADYAVDAQSTLYAVGSQNKKARILGLDLENGKKTWDRTYDTAQEFSSVMVSPENDYLLAGSRDGGLYKIETATGDLLKTIELLEPGETRPVTNDYSVLNPAFSPDGRYYVVTINPKAYILKAGTDDILHIATPADRLVSRIAFSPDDRFFATSDIRAGYPVKIWPLPQSE